MSDRATWKTLLEPFAREFAALDSDIDQALRSMSDIELAKVVAATKRPTQANCWWAIYRVAPIVADLAAEERYRRKTIRREARKRDQAVVADGRD